MAPEQHEPKLAMSNGFMNLQDQYLNSMMDVKAARNPTFLKRGGVVPLVEGRKSEYCRSFSGQKTSRYFTLESLFLLVCLTASLLILPLILPPLPPPPLMLLLLPICILALLMILAFVSSNVRDATSSLTHKYV